MTTYIKLDRREPYYRHDCDGCRYRGSFISVPSSAYEGAPTGEARPSLQDVYFHAGEGSIHPNKGSILLRDGNEPEDYVSFPRDVVERMITIGDFGDWRFAHTMVATAKRYPRNNVTSEERAKYWDGEPQLFKIIRQARVDQSSDYGGQHTVINVIELQGNMEDPQEELSFLRAFYPSTHCRHEHDCCGHYYGGTAKITRLPNGKYIVRQQFTQNV